MSLTFLKRSPLGASSMASATCVGVRKTSRNLMTFGWLNLQTPPLLRPCHSPGRCYRPRPLASQALPYTGPRGNPEGASRARQKQKTACSSWEGGVCRKCQVFWRSGLLTCCSLESVTHRRCVQVTEDRLAEQSIWKSCTLSDGEAPSARPR